MTAARDTPRGPTSEQLRRRALQAAAAEAVLTAEDQIRLGDLALDSTYPLADRTQVFEPCPHLNAMYGRCQLRAEHGGYHATIMGTWPAP